MVNMLECIYFDDVQQVWQSDIYSDISSKACVHACLTKCYRMIERNKDGPDRDSNPGPWISSQMLYSLRSAGSGIWTSLSAHSSPHPPPQMSFAHKDYHLQALSPGRRTPVNSRSWQGTTWIRLGEVWGTRPEFLPRLPEFLFRCSTHWALGPRHLNRSDQHTLKSLNIEDLHVVL